MSSVKVKKRDLYPALNRVVRASASWRSAMPSLQHVLLQARGHGLRLWGSDLVLTAAVDVEAEGGEDSWEVTAPARRLLSWVKAVASDEIILRPMEGGLEVVTKNGFRARFRSLDPDEFPKPEGTLEEPPLAQFQVHAEVWKEATRYVGLALAREEVRAVLMGFSLRQVNGGLHLAATDGFRLAVWPLAVQADLDGAEVDVVLPGRETLEVSAWLEGQITVQVHERLVAFQAEGIQAWLLPVEGRYPNYTPLLPQDSRLRVKTQGEILQAALRALLALGKRDDWVQVDIYAHQVRFAIRDEEHGFGEAKVPAEVEGQGLPFRIFFNLKFLADAVSLSQGEVYLHFNTPATPVLVTSPGMEAKGLVMPMHIQEGIPNEV